MNDGIDSAAKVGVESCGLTEAVAYSEEVPEPLTAEEQDELRSVQSRYIGFVLNATAGKRQMDFFFNQADLIYPRVLELEQRQGAYLRYQQIQQARAVVEAAGTPSTAELAADPNDGVATDGVPSEASYPRLVTD